jgi:hypothetical protein
MTKANTRRKPLVIIPARFPAKKKRRLTGNSGPRLPVRVLSQEETAAWAAANPVPRVPRRYRRRRAVT